MSCNASTADIEHVIPTHWFRRIILVLFIMEVGGGMLWVAGYIAPSPDRLPLFQTIGSLLFLFGFYASTPLLARFLAPYPCHDPARLARIARAGGQLAPDCRPVFLYEHADKEANTMGIMPAQSRIYLTTSLLDRLSDDGLLGVLAHEHTHAQERHILATFCYATAFALGSHFLGSKAFFFGGLFLFLAMRRYFEYRADAGAARLAGNQAMLTALQELAALYPPKTWYRWLSWLTAYPTLPMRIRALETGRMALV